jgi:hypothetical protein
MYRRGPGQEGRQSKDGLPTHCYRGATGRDSGDARVTKTPNETKPAALVANDTDGKKGTLRDFAGSRFDEWNDIITCQTVEALWLKHSGPETRDKQFSAALAGLRGIGPKDELEGMMAAQLIAAHNAAMECYRRAMIPDQHTEGRRENLTQANKLSRTFATLLEALNRHRGKGQQKVTVEHVHVHSGGQAVVGVVEPPGGGDRAKLENQSHAGQIGYAPQSEMWCPVPDDRAAVPTGSDGEWPVPDARRNKSGCSEG